MNTVFYNQLQHQLGMGSPALGVSRLFLYGCWTAILLPIQALAVALRLPLRRDLPRFYHEHCLRIMGITVAVRGQRSRAHPTLFVANHSSYLDITVLGSLIKGSFVAKTEVAGWPLFGLLAKLQETVFVDRQRRTVGTQRADMKSRLEARDNLILFPEGTSSDGNRILPFKTALFAVASVRVDGKPLSVQPVSVTATELDGIPMGRGLRPLYAWYGDMDMAPHLWNAVKQSRMTVAVEFHEPVTVEQFGSRKALADHCYGCVAVGVSRAVGGRFRETGSAIAIPAPDVIEAGAI